MCQGLFWVMGNQWWRPSYWRDGAYIPAGLDKNLENKFKKSSQVVISPKRNHGKRIQGQQGCCCTWELRSPSGEVMFGQRHEVSELISGWGGSQCSGWGRRPPCSDTGIARPGDRHGLRGQKGEWEGKRWDGAGLGCGELQSSGWGLGTRFCETASCKVPDIVGVHGPLDKWFLTTYHLLNPLLGKGTEMG